MLKNIELSGNSAKSDSDNGVSVNGSTITITKEGTYIVSGPKLGLTSIDVKNSKTVLPQTGGQGNIIAYSIAFILLVAGGTVFFISRRKKKSNNKAA